MAHFPRRLLCSALAFGLTAPPALAREPRTPPPSGIVIHLFGPQSVTSQIMSGAHGPDGAHGPNGAPRGTAGNPSGGMTWHDVAHQMFVTGDPAQEGAAALPKGRSGTH